ncbi:MAG TPA: hypothetical protein VM367_13700, partial [Pseudonocardia sp.]|nr:hypothetical protein [Pseudonocardia sp.]
MRMVRVPPAVLLAVLLAAGCGVPLDDEPEPLTVPTVPPVPTPTVSGSGSSSSWGRCRGEDGAGAAGRA